jgi:hypothetical protein
MQAKKHKYLSVKFYDISSSLKEKCSFKGSGRNHTKNLRSCFCRYCSVRGPLRCDARLKVVPEGLRVFAGEGMCFQVCAVTASKLPQFQLEHTRPRERLT